MKVFVVTMLLQVASMTRESIAGCEHQESKLACRGLKGQPHLDHPALEHVTHLEILDIHIPVLTNISAPPRNNSITTLKIDARLEEFGDHYFSNFEILQKLLLENNYIIVMNKWVKHLHLEYLDLSGNLIEYIDARTLEIPTLIYLFLSRNKIKEIQAHFLILPELFSLDISKNEITNIDIHAFTFLTKLYSLNLSGNKINNVEHVFSPVVGLIELNLSQNKISNVDLAFSKFTRLEVLYLENNKLSNLNNRPFRYLRSLKQLFLSGNKLSKIYSTYFKHNPIRQLHMSDCNISYIEAHALPSTLYLLKLKNNQLTNIISTMFGHSKSLIDLDLSSNHIVHVDGNAFKNLPMFNPYIEGNKLGVGELVHLISNQNYKLIKRNNGSSFYFLHFTTARSTVNLAYNQVRLLHSYTFVDNNKLIKLLLDNNQLNRLVNHTFIGLEQLTHLDLEYNNISYVEFGAFYGLFKLDYLYLSGNKICRQYTLGMSGCSLCEFYTDSEYVSKFELNIQCALIPCTVKSRVGNTINMTDKIEGSPEYSYVGSELQPQVLTLAHNNISILSYSYFKKLTRLIMLNVSLNTITELNVSLFYSQKELTELDIEFNNITQLDIESLKFHIEPLKRVFINGNPWDCDYLVDLIRSMDDHNITYVNLRKPSTPNDINQINGVQCRMKQIQRLVNRFNWQLLLLAMIPFISLLVLGLPLFMLHNKRKKNTAKLTTSTVEEIELEKMETCSANDNK